MMIQLRLASVSLLLLSPILADADTVIVDEDFESYANSSAMYTTWAPADSLFNGKLVDETYTEFITLDDIDPQPVGARAFPEGGQGAEHFGGSVLEYQPLLLSGPIVPTESQSIVLQGDIFDTGNFGNKRMTIGLRSITPNNIVELGHWNAELVELATRVILFENPIGPSWQAYELPVSLDRPDDADEITTIGDLGEAWHTHRVTITPTSQTFEIDLFRDGIDARTGQPGFDAEITVEAEPFAAGFDSLRIGGPSNVSSAGNGFYGGVIYDNISLTLVDVGGGGLEGDYNGDSMVDSIDYAVWREALGDTVTPGDGADGNENGVIDQGDFDIWLNNYGASISPASGASLAPEPTAIACWVLACGLAAAKRRRS